MIRTVIYIFLKIILYPLHLLYVLGDYLESSETVSMIIMFATFIYGETITWMRFHPAHWYSVIGTLIFGALVFFVFFTGAALLEQCIAYLCLFIGFFPEKLYQAVSIRVAGKEAYNFYLLHVHKKIYDIQCICK